MNERIRSRIARGKLPEVKVVGSDRLDIPAVLALNKRRRNKGKRPNA